MKHSGRRNPRIAGLEFEARIGASGGVLGQEDDSTPLHAERLEAVCRHLAASGAASVLDLGCGSGALMMRLVADARFQRVLGVDTSAAALLLAERRLEVVEQRHSARWSLQHGSLMEPADDWRGFDAVAAIETIEHIPPEQLSRVERTVFYILRPQVAVVTTPNREYNVRYGLSEGEFRHPDHRFEWDRVRFRSWADGVCRRTGYSVEVEDVGRADPFLGSPTQLAVFRLPEG